VMRIDYMGLHISGRRILINIGGIDMNGGNILLLELSCSYFKSLSTFIRCLVKNKIHTYFPGKSVFV